MQLINVGHRVQLKQNAPMESIALQIFPVIQTLQKHHLVFQLLPQPHHTNSVEAPWVKQGIIAGSHVWEAIQIVA